MQSFIGENPFTTKAKVVVQTRGRGADPQNQMADNDTRYANADFESFDEDVARNTSNAQKSVEGWVVIVTNVHEEAQEDDLIETFGDYGHVSQCHLNLDRRTGFAKGYALIEFQDFNSARDAIKALNGSNILGQQVAVDWAFNKPAKRA
jgi:RNA-binding protein 8A